MITTLHENSIPRNDKPPHVIFAGGGTGGHLFPGLAVAAELRRRWNDVAVTFIGCGSPIEREWVTAAGYDYVILPCRPAPKRLWHFPGFLLDNLAGYRAARRFLAHHPAAVVVGLGGYASAPMGRAARAASAKLVLLEQNTIPGRVNRWLARSADVACVAFAETAQRLRCQGEVRVTGTPIRPGFADASPPTQRRRLLVLGGSGGAVSLNESVPRALYKVRQHLDGGEIVHQAGPHGVEATERLYKKLGLEAEVVPFIVDMPRMLGWTGLAVSRAGGSALAELAAAGVPTILLPYPHAANDHQRRNAELFRSAGGCVLIDQRELTGRLDEALAEAMVGLLKDRPRREQISRMMQTLARPNATTEVARIIERLAGRAPSLATLPTLDAFRPARPEGPEPLAGLRAVRPRRPRQPLLPTSR
ncbi:MAG TPA: undecaprenyldiphospho-muramoylpentapeptide beta-N-acetylglucosaminyltransferase [Thermoguttaceae bacterium]|nr:undecaprenyldiphospho-muramoylpentapeptide beta-N-acetylglucosaminyltransferase [Thermoguttaceae bacterium]